MNGKIPCRKSIGKVRRPVVDDFQVKAASPMCECLVPYVQKALQKRAAKGYKLKHAQFVVGCIEDPFVYRDALFRSMPDGVMRIDFNYMRFILIAPYDAEDKCIERVLRTSSRL